jgi:hypothetical protein
MLSKHYSCFKHKFDGPNRGVAYSDEDFKNHVNKNVVLLVTSKLADELKIDPLRGSGYGLLNVSPQRTINDMHENEELRALFSNIIKIREDKILENQTAKLNSTVHDLKNQAVLEMNEALIASEERSIKRARFDLNEVKNQARIDLNLALAASDERARKNLIEVLEASEVKQNELNKNNAKDIHDVKNQIYFLERRISLMRPKIKAGFF